MLYSCRVAVESVFGKKENLTRKLLFPASSSGRQDLLSEIYSTRKPLQLSVEAEEYDIIGKTNGSISSATNQIKKERMQTDLFILPLQQMHANLLSSNIIPNFVGITLSPTLNDGGFGSIESRIKAAMTHLCDIEQNNDIMLRLDLKLERKLQQFVRAMSGTESVESLSTSRSRQQVESTASTLRNFLRVSTVDPTSATAITTQSPLATSHSQNSSSKMHQKSVSSVRPKSRSRF